jgi:hypothetical protein
MADHTRGPWLDQKTGLILGADGDIVADFVRPEDRPLLAAAPDLLDACQAFVAALDNTKFDVFIGSPAELLRLADARRAALAAIAKTAGT